MTLSAILFLKTNYSVPAYAEKPLIGVNGYSSIYPPQSFYLHAITASIHA
jgi:hypothetical protein